MLCVCAISSRERRGPKIVCCVCARSVRASSTRERRGPKMKIVCCVCAQAVRVSAAVLVTNKFLCACVFYAVHDAFRLRTRAPVWAYCFSEIFITFKPVRVGTSPEARIRMRLLLVSRDNNTLIHVHKCANESRLLFVR